MIIPCNKCNGSGEHNSFPSYSKAKCETCDGTGEMMSFIFDIHTVHHFESTNEIEIFLSWFKDQQMKMHVHPEKYALPVQLILNHHICKDMTKEQMNEYILEFFDSSDCQFNLPEIFTTDQIKQLNFFHENNSLPYETRNNRNDNH